MDLTNITLLPPVGELSLVEDGPLVPARKGHLSRLENRDWTSGTKGPHISPGPVTSRDKWSSTWPPWRARGAPPLVPVGFTARDK